MGEGKHTEIDFEAVSGGVLDAIRPVIEREVREAANQLYGATMEAVQDYLSDNVDFNIKSRLDAAERERLIQCGRAERMEKSRDALLEALTEARTTLSILRTQVMVEIRLCADPSESRWEGVPDKLKERLDDIDAAITRATAPMQEGE